MDGKPTASSLSKRRPPPPKKEGSGQGTPQTRKPVQQHVRSPSLQTASKPNAPAPARKLGIESSSTNESPAGKPMLRPQAPSLKLQKEPKVIANEPKVTPRTYRLRRIPSGYRVETLEETLRIVLGLGGPNDLRVRSLAVDHIKDEQGEPFLVATLECKDILAYTKSTDSSVGEAKLRSSTRSNEWKLELQHPSQPDKTVEVFLDLHFTGFTALSQLGGTYVIDCIAIHGWGSHAFGAFKAANEDFMWLRDRLPKDIPSLRMWSYGYDFGLQAEDSFAGMDDHADTFRHLLKDMRISTQASERTPLLFIAHSLGGIILKQAITEMKASSDSREQAMLDCIVGITFFGVPSQGMRIQALALMVGDKPQSYDLNRLNQDVGYRLRDKEHRAFCEAFNYRDANIKQFFETKKTKDVVEDPATKKWTRNGPSNILVTISSATSCGRDWENTSDFKIPLNCDHIGMVKFGESDQEDYPKVRLVLDDMAQAAHQILTNRNNASREEQEAFLGSLSFPEMGNRENQIRQPLASTCQWIWRDEVEDFSRWLNDNDPKCRAFVVEGKPGSGKSTLVKHITERRRQSASQHGNEFVVSFFFNERGSTIERSADALLRTCLHHILQRYRAGFRKIIDIYRRKRKQIQELGLEKVSWDTATLMLMFSIVITAIHHDMDNSIFQRLLVVIDGLDEWDASASQLKDIVDLLLQDIPKSTYLMKVCFSTRPNTRTTFLNKFPRLILQTRNQQDIVTYVKKTAADALEDDSDFSMLTDEVIYKADGIILWAELVLKELLEGKSEGNTIAELQETLQSIPTGLKELFERMLARIEPKYRPESKTILRTILFARKPLSIEELRCLTAFGMEGFNDLEQYMGSRQVAHKDRDYVQRLQSRGGGLIEVRTIDTRKDEKSTVQFIHQAAKEFIAKDSDFLNPSTPFSAVHVGNHFLLQACTRYLSVADFGKEQWISKRRGALCDKYPLLEYASESWMDHWRETLDSRDGSVIVLDEATDFASGGLKNWLRIHNVLSYGWPLHTEDTTLASIAAEMGLLDYIEFVTRGSFDVNELTGRYGHLLQAAARYGHLSIVRMLLERGANINAYGGHYGTALLAAVSSGHDDIVECLLMHNASVTVIVGHEETVLRAALISCKLKTVTRLLEAGAYAEENEDDKKSILYEQAIDTKWPLVELLLRHGAKINQTLPRSGGKRSQTPAGGWTLLHIAVDQNAPPTVIKMLLEQGADRTLRDDLSRTALRLALHLNHTEALKVLIAATSDVEESTSDDDWNTIHCLSVRGDVKVLDMALSLSPRLDRKTKEGWKPLHIAAEAQNLEMLTRLVKSDSSLNEANGEGWTALHIAAHKGFERGVEVLLSAGADINATIPKLWTALHMATYHGQSEIVRLLIMHNADLEKTTDEGYTALHLAAQRLEDNVSSPKARHTSTEKSSTRVVYSSPASESHPDQRTQHQRQYQRLNAMFVSPVRESSRSLSGGPYYTSGAAYGSQYSGPSSYYSGRHTYTAAAPLNIGYPSSYYSPRATADIYDDHSLPRRRNSQSNNGYLFTRNSYLSTAESSSRYPTVQDSSLVFGHRQMGQNTSTGYYSDGAHYPPRSSPVNGYSRYARTGNYSTPPAFTATRDTRMEYDSVRVRSTPSPRNKPRSDSTSQGSEKLRMIKLLLEAGANINCKTREGWTVLHFVAKSGDFESAQVALLHNADVNATTQELWTPLHLAVHHKRTRVATALLGANAALDLKTNKGLTALHLCVNAEDENLFNVLLPSCSNLHVNIVANAGYTALHLAAEMAQIGVIYSLLRKGVDEESRDKENKTALQMVPSGEREAEFLLLPTTARFIKTLHLDANVTTVLHTASQEGHLRVVELLLLNAKINVNVLDEKQRTPLHAAIEGKRPRVVRFLLRNAADVSAPDSNGFQPLHLAAATGQVEISKSLLQKHPSIQATTAEGMTPLHLACKYGHYNIAMALIGYLPEDIVRPPTDQGKIFDDMDLNGYTALHWAAEKGHGAILQLLIRHKAPLEVCNRDGYTALQLAAKSQNTSAVQSLLKAGANLPVSDGPELEFVMAQSVANASNELGNGKSVFDLDDDWGSLTTSKKKKKKAKKDSGSNIEDPGTNSTFDAFHDIKETGKVVSDLDDDWGTFTTGKKKKKDKNASGSNTEVSGANSTFDAFHDIKLDDAAPTSDLGFEPANPKTTNSGFGAWGSSWATSGTTWDFSASTTAQAGDKQTGDVENDDNPWSVNRGRLKGKSVGFSFDVLHEELGTDPIEAENKEDDDMDLATESNDNSTANGTGWQIEDSSGKENSQPAKPQNYEYVIETPETEGLGLGIIAEGKDMFQPSREWVQFANYPALPRMA